MTLEAVSSFVARTLPLALAAACSGAPPDQRSGPDAQPREVAIENRTGLPLWLCRAVRDGWAVPRPLGDAAVLTLDLPPGRYALQLGSDGPRVPLPLPATELGFVPPAATTVEVWPWPASQAGWCWVPPGLGLCGDDLGIGQEDERPVTTPWLPGFWLAARETTNAEFTTFLNALDATTVDRRWIDLGGPKCRVQWDATAHRFTTDAPELPIVKVRWDGAVAYCHWLTATTGTVHRLPTESEWEKAARGPGSRVYAYGDTFRTAAANQESGELVAVARFAPSEFGLFDMTGNAFEWTSDAFARDGDDQADPDGDHRALRGGSFVLDGIFVRNAMRMRLRPDVRADDVGFRVLRENTDPTSGPVATSPTRP